MEVKAYFIVNLEACL